MTVQIEAILSGFSTKSDGGLSLRFSTNEVSDTDILALSKLKNSFGWLAFKENQFTLDDLPKEQAEDANKTPSKRLRASLYVLFQQEGSNGDFEAFYRERMEKLIKFIQNKLD